MAGNKNNMPHPYSKTDHKHDCKVMAELSGYFAKKYEGSLHKQAQIAEAAMHAFSCNTTKPCYDCVFNVLIASTESLPKRKKWARKR